MKFLRTVSLSSLVVVLIIGLLSTSVFTMNTMASNDKITVTVRFTYIHFEDVVDTGKNDYPDIKFEIHIEDNVKQTEKRQDIKNGSIEPVMETNLYVNNISTLDILIKCIDTNPLMKELVDIDPENDDRSLNIEYDRRDGSLSGEDDDFKVDGSKDGSSGTHGANDQNDATLEYEINAPTYQTKNGVDIWTIAIIAGIFVFLAIVVGSLYLIKKRKKSRGRFGR